jgi:predicted nucleic acid-binding protein
VIDTSVLIAVIVEEPEKEQLILKTTGTYLWAPSSCHWEIGNAFSAMMKRNRITLVQTKKALRIYQQIPVRWVDVNIESAVEISNQLGIYAYDAYILACAAEKQCALISLDKGLLRAARTMGLQVMEMTT